VPNPITEGRALPINEKGVAIEVFQIAYIVITAIIIAKERGERRSQIIKELKFSPNYLNTLFVLENLSSRK
jgi:hypothetical protein